MPKGVAPSPFPRHLPMEGPMSRPNRGFTLIELMIVVAIIAIVAAIAIPSLLRSRVAANEVSAQAGMKQFVNIEATWRQTDADRNGVQDYWTLDIAGFYAITDAAGQTLKFVDIQVAKADQTGSAAYPVVGGSNPKATYFFTAMTRDEVGAAYALDADADGVANTNVAKFAFTAYPFSYRETGQRQFIVNEQGVVYQRDLGTSTPIVTWPSADPSTLGWTASE